jgi:hypothetical protein
LLKIQFKGFFEVIKGGFTLKLLIFNGLFLMGKLVFSIPSRGERVM